MRPKNKPPVESFSEGREGDTYWQIYRLSNNEYDVIVSHLKRFAFGTGKSMKEAKEIIVTLEAKLKDETA